MESIAHLVHQIAASPFGFTGLVLIILLAGLFVMEWARFGFAGARDLGASFRQHPFGTLVLALVLGAVVFTGTSLVSGIVGWLQAIGCPA